jgi:1-acyl-sn-glycerol-3-phosphate acyltransferase
MIVKVIRVIRFMLARLLFYGWRRMTGNPRLDQYLEQDYRGWAEYVLDVFGVELKVEGREFIPALSSGKLVVASNHQSQIDIPALIHALQRRMGFVAKKELASIPLLNYWMRQVGCVFIDRSDRAGAHKALEQAAAGMGLHPLVVFPEGTRSKDGKLLPAKLGGFRLALMAGAQVLPVLIEGTRDAAENRAPGAKRVPARVRIFPPLDARGLPEGKASLNRLKEYVEACWSNAAVAVPAVSAAPAAPAAETGPAA